MMTVPAAAQIHFTNVGAASNTLARCNTHGSGFFDADQDGWDDIFVVHNTSLGEYVHLPNTLLKNPTTGIFHNITDAAGVAGYLDVSAQGLAAADYDNDGRMDICIGMGNRYYQLCVYRQNSNFTFTDISGWAIRDRGTLNGRNLAFIDYDRNGWVDLLILKDDILNDPSDYCLTLYRNRQNGSFENVTVAAGLNLPPNANDLFGFAVADADNNGYPDVYVPRLSAASLYLRNVNGIFHESSVAAGLPHGTSYLGAVFLDYNNDGYWDLFLKRQDASVQLFANDRDGTFTNVTAAAGLSGIDTGHLPEESGFGGGLTAADFDNNGWTDILVINRYGTRNKLLMNNGDGTFSERAFSAGIQENIDYYWSTPIADYNRDGYLDIYMARSPGGAPSSNDAALYRNDGGSAHWLAVRLTGVTSNRSAVGTRLTAYAGGGQQIRQVLGGDGYKTNSYWNHFGLGAATAVDSLVVAWPSGTVQKGTEIPAGTYLEMTEKDTVQYYGPPYIAGTVRHRKSGAPVPGVRTHLTGDLTLDATTDANGRYKLKPVPMGSVSLFATPDKAAGEDVGDAGVTAYDAALTLRWITGLEPLTDTQKSEADVDMNGSIDALDAAFIARYSVGIRDDAGSLAGSWRFTPSSREYSQLVRENDAEDYQCGILGDVTENWGDPGVPGKAQAGSAPSCPETIPFSGEALEVPLILGGETEMLAADVRLRFDPSRLEFTEATPEGQASGFCVATHEESPGCLKIALYGAAPAKAAGTVLNIRFLVKDRAPGPVSILWERIAINERDFGPAATTALPAGTGEGEKPSGFTIRGNYPNPFNPGTTVVYSIGRESETRLVLFDSRGREVRTLFRGRQSPGEHRVEWDGLDSRGSDMPPGLYFCRLTAGPESRVIKMAKVK